MKGVTILLLFLICAGGASGQMCKSCHGKINSDCVHNPHLVATEYNCGYCSTTVTRYANSTTGLPEADVLRGCNTQCEEIDTEIVGIWIQTKCCHRDLCNNEPIPMISSTTKIQSLSLFTMLLVLTGRFLI